ncbi:MAG: leucine-rich repeat domain-containing protein [Porphyromonadaceae bacterium]|nr:leucine-rich repeat domain-containing protein [Porphyromonadaceae bacterium]
MFVVALLSATMLLFADASLRAEEHSATVQNHLRAEAGELKTFFVAPLRYAILDEAAKKVEVTKWDREDKVDPNALKELKIPETVEHGGKAYTVVSIGKRAFEYASHYFTECTMPKTIEVIKEGAFVGTRLKRISIPDNVIEIEDNAFSSVDNATTLHLGAKLEKIGKNAFSGLDYLEIITLNEQNKHFALQGDVLYDKQIKKVYLASCHKKSFQTYVMPNTVEEVLPSAMMQSKYLKKITLSSNLKKIGARAFFGCGALQELELPASLTEFDRVGSNSQMYALKSIKVADGNPKFTSINGSLYSKDGKTLLRHPEGHPDSLNVVLPNGLERIDDSAFEGGGRVKQIVIPQTVKTIGHSAFASTGIRSLRLPDQLEELSSYLFYNVKYLEELHIGSKLKTVGTSAFDICPSLKRVFIAAPEPPVFYVENDDDLNEFPAEIETGSTLTVSIGAAAKYREAPEWNRFAEIVESANVAIEELAEQGLKISVDGSVLHVSSASPVAIEVFSMLGERVFASQTVQTEFAVTLPVGTYMIKQGKHTAKIVIE